MHTDELLLQQGNDCRAGMVRKPAKRLNKFRSRVYKVIDKQNHQLLQKPLRAAVEYSRVEGSWLTLVHRKVVCHSNENSKLLCDPREPPSIIQMRDDQVFLPGIVTIQAFD